MPKMKYYKNSKHFKITKLKASTDISLPNIAEKPQIIKKNKYQNPTWIFIIAFIMLAISIRFLYFDRPKAESISSQTTDTQEQKGFYVDVSYLEPFKYIKKLTIYGSSRSYRDLIIIPEVDAKVKEIKVKRGEEVKKDQILITLTKPQYQSLVNEAEISLSNSKLEYQTTKALYKDKLASMQELKKAKAIYEEDQAKLKIAQDNLSGLSIKAPFDAKIEDIFIELGEVVSNYKTSLLKIIDDDRLIITGFIAESKVNSLLIGDSAKVLFENNQEAEGEVVFIAGESDPDTRTFKVEVLINNNTKIFRSGMTAKINIPYDKVTAYKIKPSYLTLNNEGEVGLKYVENNHVKFTKVEILEEEGDYMIVSNIKEHLPIIITGHGFVKEGQRVSLLERDHESL